MICLLFFHCCFACEVTVTGTIQSDEEIKKNSMILLFSIFKQ